MALLCPRRSAAARVAEHFTRARSLPSLEKSTIHHRVGRAVHLCGPCMLHSLQSSECLQWATTA